MRLFVRAKTFQGVAICIIHNITLDFFFFWVKLYIIPYIENPVGLCSKEKSSYALPVKDGGMWDSVSLLMNPLKGAW